MNIICKKVSRDEAIKVVVRKESIRIPRKTYIVEKNSGVGRVKTKISKLSIILSNSPKNAAQKNV